MSHDQQPDIWLPESYGGRQNQPLEGPIIFGVGDGDGIMIGSIAGISFGGGVLNLETILGAHPVDDPDTKIFDEFQKQDICEIAKSTVEYAAQEAVTALVLVDRAARLMHVGFKEYWKATRPDEKVPDIFFIEPEGFKELDKSRKHTQEKFEEDHPFLAAHRAGKLLVADTCIHRGRSMRPILSVLRRYGFKDTKVAVVRDNRNMSRIKPDKSLIERVPDLSCYPYGEIGLVTQHTAKYLYSDGYEYRNSFRIRKIRDEIREIVRTNIREEQEEGLV